MYEYWYSVVEHCDESRYKVSARWKYSIDSHLDIEMLARECAEDYDRDDGWEHNYPLTFAIYKEENGEEIGRALVYREYSYEYHSYVH